MYEAGDQGLLYAKQLPAAAIVLETLLRVQVVEKLLENVASVHCAAFEEEFKIGFADKVNLNWNQFWILCKAMVDSEEVLYSL